MENFHNFVFRGIKTIYLFWSTFLSILHVQDATLRVLLKVINKQLLLKLESGIFLSLKLKWYLDKKLVAF